MKRALIISLAIFFVASIVNVSAFALAKDTQTKVGWITDTLCKEKGMKMGKSCALMCVKERGAKFAFYDPESMTTFEIDNQDKAMDFAGEKVELKGVFDAEKKTVTLEKIKKVKMEKM